MKPPSKTPDIQEKNVGWTETVIPIAEPKPHEHYFEWREGECKCKVCPFGLLGVVEIENGRPR